VSAPILLADLGGVVGDDSVEDREDGVKGVGQLSAVRSRKSRKALALSTMQNLEAAAVWIPDWERAEEIDRLMRHDGPGRQMQTNAMTMFVFGEATRECGSRAAKAERELGDPATWARLCATVAAVFRDDPSRRLHPKPPTYKQFWRFRHTYLESSERLGEVKRDEAIAVARRLGLFDPAKGSLSNPSADNVVYGDAKVLNGPFNTTAVDPVTGEPTGRRHDPDMHPYHKGDRRTGRRMVSICVRSDHFNERVMLNVTTMHVTLGNDGTEATDMIIDLGQLVHVAAADYDMALYPANHDRLMAAGIAPVAKVQRTSKATPAKAILGEHTFTLADGSKESMTVMAVDGWAGIIVPTVEGPKWVALEPSQVKKAQNKAGSWRWWQYWRIRDLPEVPRQWRGAQVHIRHSWVPDDGEKSRSRVLRLHPEGSDSYQELYRRRNDIESMHRHLQDLMFNERVNTIGDRNLRVWLHSYQTHVNRTALIAWHYRTGGDVSAWFGNWLPPPQQRQAAA
jgi:hypothetical protein